jgi:hypothetical protein
VAATVPVGSENPSFPPALRRATGEVGPTEPLLAMTPPATAPCLQPRRLRWHHPRRRPFPRSRRPRGATREVGAEGTEERAEESLGAEGAEEQVAASLAEARSSGGEPGRGATFFLPKR